jgi:hypothetical protein
MNKTTVHERSIAVERNITDVIAELDSADARASNALPRAVALDRRARRAIVEAAAAQAGRLDGTPGKVLTLAHQRKLGTVVMLLWRWLLDERGPEARPRPIVLKAFLPVLFRHHRERALRDLRRKVPSEASMYRTAKRALDRLRVAGAVRTNAFRVPNSKWIDEPRNGTAPQYITTLLVTTFGKMTIKRKRVRVMGQLVRNRHPQVIIQAPDTVITWCETTAGHGGNRRGRSVQVVPELTRVGEIDATDSQTSGSSCPLSSLSLSSMYVGDSSLRSESPAAARRSPLPAEQENSPKVCAEPSKVATASRASATADSPPRCARPVHPTPLDPIMVAVRELPPGATPTAIRAAVAAAFRVTGIDRAKMLRTWERMHQERAERGQPVHPAYAALEAAERSTTHADAPPA